MRPSIVSFSTTVMKHGCLLMISWYFSFWLLGRRWWLLHKILKTIRVEKRFWRMKKIVCCIGSAADIIESVSDTVLNQPEQSCNSKLDLILWFFGFLIKSWLKSPNFTQAPTHVELNHFYNQPIKSLFQFIFLFTPYGSRARTQVSKVNAFLMQTEIIAFNCSAFISSWDLILG